MGNIGVTKEIGHGTAQKGAEKKVTDWMDSKRGQPLKSQKEEEKKGTEMAEKRRITPKKKRE